MKAYLTVLVTVLVILGFSNISNAVGPNVVAWGDNSSGQIIVPLDLTNAIAISGGGYSSLALRANGTVVAWGDNYYNQNNVPVGLSNVVAISAGDGFYLALQSNGKVAAWGNNTRNGCDVPLNLTNAVSISASANGACLALRSDGTAVAWGNNSSIPAGLSSLVAISAGANGSSLALRSDGTVVALNEQSIPAGLSSIIAISASGAYHNLALRSNGTVVAWGDNFWGQCDVPSDLTNVVAIFGGWYHSLALRSDGTVVAWGQKTRGQCDIPPGLSGVIGISSGYNHSIALLAFPPSSVTISPTSQTVGVGTTVKLEVTASGTTPFTYQWYFGTNVLAGETNSLLTLTNIQLTQSGEYHATVMNGYGSATSETATVSVALTVGVTIFSAYNIDVPLVSINGDVGSSYTLQTSNTVGKNSVWNDLATVTIADIPKVYADFSAIGRPARFYRAVQVAR